MAENVDFSQRYAHSEADEYLERAEEIVRDLERKSEFKYSGQFSDPEKRREFVEGLAAELSGKKPMPKRAQPEEEDRPFSSDEFWNSDEPKKQIPKKL